MDNVIKERSDDNPFAGFDVITACLISHWG